MRKLLLVVSTVVMISMVACSGSKGLTTQVQDGESAYQLGNYQKALTYWEEVIQYYEDAGQQKDCPVYFEAATAARQLGLPEKTIKYLKKDTYSNHAGAETYFELAKYYWGIDNLSKELESLEAYISKYPAGENIKVVKSRLFEIYVETKNWDMAIETWPSILPDAASDEGLLEGYFTTNKALENDSVCDLLAGDLLKIDENNLLALHWMGKKYFWQAENRYNTELKAYEKNKTNKQYNKLLKALNVVTADFKTSLGYFKLLYKLGPTSKNAKYLGDIYNRLDDKEKADYYYGIAEG